MAFEVSVFLENKIAHLERITNILKSEQINIRSLNLLNMMHGWGILNLLVDKPDRAYQVLADLGNSVTLHEVIALEMKDESGALDELLVKVSKAGIHIKNAYTRLIAENGMAIIVLDVPDVLEAQRLLAQNNIPVLDDKIVYGI